MARRQKPEGLRLFYSYCHADARLRKRLEAHLSLLRRQGLIKEWYDGEIGAGEEIAPEIDSNLARSDIVLLLISADFLNSDYCWNREMQRAVKRHRQGTARVIPIIVRPFETARQTTVFGSLKALPRDGKPVTKWSNRDSAWADVANGIRETIIELRERASFGAGRSARQRRRAKS